MARTIIEQFFYCNSVMSTEGNNNTTYLIDIFLLFSRTISQLPYVGSRDEDVNVLVAEQKLVESQPDHRRRGRQNSLRVRYALVAIYPILSYAINTIAARIHSKPRNPWLSGPTVSQKKKNSYIIFIPGQMIEQMNRSPSKLKDFNLFFQDKNVENGCS